MKHWHLNKDSEGIVWLGLDTADSAMNKLSKEVLQELGLALDQLEFEKPAGLVIYSEKDSGFAAGADIEEFTQLDSQEKAVELVKRGWDLFNRLAGVSYPTLSLIKGVCLGGGLELSLACRYRIAVDIPSTKLGLPEVLLGIVPAWGGMMRLPKLIGPQAALDIMLTAKSLDAKRAKRAGLVDLCVPQRLAKQSAAKLVLSKKPARKAAGLSGFMNSRLARPIIAHMAKKQVAQKARPEHYPAPYALIDIWQKHDGNALRDTKLLGNIVNSPTARNLVRVFFLQERLKAFGKEANFQAKRVHVIGAGVMGGDIAAWCALRGMTVTLQDQTIEQILPAIGRAQKLFQKRIRDPLSLRSALDRLIPDPQGHGAAHADVVIEAIFENLEAKHSLLKTLEPKLKHNALLATNTSSLRIEDIASVLAQPNRLVGIHFFNPVAQMPLVEVIRGQTSLEEEVSKALAFVRSIDKLPLPVKSAPGFLVNAVLAPYMLAAMQAVDRGLSPQAIDEALRQFGMPMGPIELIDIVGLDIAMAAGAQMSTGQEPPKCLRKLVEQKYLGKKTGQGFYKWQNGKALNTGSNGAFKVGGNEALVEELSRPLVNRAKQLVEDHVVADADLADAGIIFGTGFAPFRGGPLYWDRERKNT